MASDIEGLDFGKINEKAVKAMQARLAAESGGQNQAGPAIPLQPSEPIQPPAPILKTGTFTTEKGTEVWDNGQLITFSPAKKTGTHRMPDGSEKMYGSDGVLYQKNFPDGRKVYYYDDGATERRCFPDGREESLNRDGSLYSRKFIDGSGAYYYRDGKIKDKIAPDGSSESFDRDGNLLSRYDTNGRIIEAPETPEEKEQLVLNMEDIKEIFISQVGKSAKITRLDLIPTSEGVELILELNAGFMGGKPSIRGMVVNTTYGIDLIDKKIDANPLARSDIEEKFSDFANDTKRYFEKKYGKSVSSIKIVGSNLIVEFAKQLKPATPEPRFAQTQRIIKPLGPKPPAPRLEPPPFDQSEAEIIQARIEEAKMILRADAERKRRIAELRGRLGK